MKEVNAMTSIRSKHTVPLFGIMFGVQGQEDSLGLNIGIGSRVFPAAEFCRHAGLQVAAADYRVNTRPLKRGAATASRLPAYLL